MAALYLRRKWDDGLGAYSPPRGHVIYTFYRRTSPAFDLYTISLQRCVHDIFFTKRRVGVTLVLLYTFITFLPHFKDFGSLIMRVRERRSWTKEEDNMLRAAIKLGEGICQVILTEIRRSTIGSDRGTPY